MASYIYCTKQEKLIPKEDYLMAKYFSQDDKHMTVGNKKVQIFYNSDIMEPTKHMVSGKHYTSKKKFRDETKARGCIEVGNDIINKPRAPIKLDRRQRREHIRKAIHDLKNGNVPRMTK